MLDNPYLQRYVCGVLKNFVPKSRFGTRPIKLVRAFKDKNLRGHTQQRIKNRGLYYSILSGFGGERIELFI